tara:strand:+ start:239 stop:442 length:204 start_codon:yes stop_codon:yes gene_type:complete
LGAKAPFLNIMNIKTQPTYALKNMIKALSMHKWLNTEEENERLALAKKELEQRQLEKLKQKQLHYQY